MMKTKEEIEKRLEECERIEIGMRNNVENYFSNDFKIIDIKIKLLEWVLDI